MLNSEVVTPRGGEPERWVYVLHGIFGAGRNWGTVARALVERRPDLGAVLVDLREHGGSRGFAPPHTIEAAAADLRELESASDRPVAVMLGHSFGGKVALGYVRDPGPALERVWIVDSTPSPRDEPAGSAWEMLRIIRALPDRFESRDTLIEALVERGVERPVAQWMATNLERGDDGSAMVWRFDLDAIEALLRDFFRADLWDVVEAPPPGVALHFVKATRSSVLDARAVERIERAGVTRGSVVLHPIEGGHWLNVDNPDALVGLLEEAI
ncbi:MAG: alpha/beta fold hydrolase [Longimicrobiales bacterium]